MPRIIRSAGELGPGKPVLIYGAGERGAQFGRDLFGAGLKCAGFLDSFKAGEQGGLPVHRYDEVPDQLLRASRVVIASFMHVAIANRLSMDGIDDYLVLADSAEGLNPVPLARDVEEALDLLAEMPISLKRSAPPKNARRSCSALNQCLWVGMDGLKYCCFMPDVMYYQPVDRLVPNLESLRRGLYQRLDQGRRTCCDGCTLLTAAGERPEPYRIRHISLGHNSRCNFKCSYCTTRKNLRTASDGLALALVRGLASSGMLAEDLEFAWAGEGEPVLDPDFEEIVGLFLGHGSRGLIYTNASIHSPLLEKGLREGRLRIVTSLDAGTPETFQRMHGVDAFGRVMENLRGYLSGCAPEAISLKYILTPDNADEAETMRFVEQCSSLGIRKVIISSDYTLAVNPCAEQTQLFRQAALDAGLEVSMPPWMA